MTKGGHDMRKITGIPYGEHKENLLDLYLPDEGAFDLFLYAHGGGMEAGNRAKEAVVYEHLAQHGIAVASIDYRMYPEAKYPDFVEDTAAAAAWVHAHIGGYGDCRRIFIGGSSAGAYLSMMLCFDERWLGAHGLSAADFAGFVHDAGQPTKHFNVLRELGIDTRRVIVDDTAPLYHIGKTIDLPPMLFIVSDNDMENRIEQTTLVRSTLRHFGFPEEKMPLRLMHGKHCHYLRQMDEHGSVLGGIIEEFIRACP